MFPLPAAAIFEATIFHHSIPLMFLTYLGALKAWLYAPVLALFEPSYVSVRLPVLLLGGFTVWLAIRLLESMHGRLAPGLGGLLLPPDAMSLLPPLFHLGPLH